MAARDLVQFTQTLEFAFHSRNRLTLGGVIVNAFLVCSQVDKGLGKSFAYLAEEFGGPIVVESLI